VRHERRAPVSYELTPANVAEVRLVKELLAEAHLGEGVARELLGDLAYQSEALADVWAERGVLLVTERANQRGRRQRIEVCFSDLKRAFGLDGTLARRRWWGWPPGSRPRSPLTPTAATSTGFFWDVRRAALRSCGRRDSATDI
jgi:hypothetical protein